jgi:hypothetical protein
MTNRSEDEPAEFSSPACSMPEADDAYMGYAERVELATFLNELLEAERAGSRVTLQSARAASAGPVANLMWTIQRDEARWCAMLTRHLKALGETPSTKVGAFYGKAMAIQDLTARTIFLNRGQDWVVRKLRAMLPRVRDDRLHADFTEMLQSHEANIALANNVVRPAES